MITAPHVLLAIGILGLILSGLIFSGYHTTALNASADAYTACVQQQYHTTPSAFYGEQGHYPECK
jgi:hypothetical protein